MSDSLPSAQFYFFHAPDFFIFEYTPLQPTRNTSQLVFSSMKKTKINPFPSLICTAVATPRWPCRGDDVCSPSDLQLRMSLETINLLNCFSLEVILRILTTQYIFVYIFKMFVFPFYLHDAGQFHSQ